MQSTLPLTHIYFVSKIVRPRTFEVHQRSRRELMDCRMLVFGPGHDAPHSRRLSVRLVRNERFIHRQLRCKRTSIVQSKPNFCYLTVNDRRVSRSCLCEMYHSRWTLACSTPLEAGPSPSQLGLSLMVSLRPPLGHRTAKSACVQLDYTWLSKNIPGSQASANQLAHCLDLRLKAPSPLFPSSFAELSEHPLVRSWGFI